MLWQPGTRSYTLLCHHLIIHMNTHGLSMSNNNLTESVKICDLFAKLFWVFGISSLVHVKRYLMLLIAMAVNHLTYYTASQRWFQTQTYTSTCMVSLKQLASWFCCVFLGKIQLIMQLRFAHGGAHYQITVSDWLFQPANSLDKNQLVCQMSILSSSV